MTMTQVEPSVHRIHVSLDSSRVYFVPSLLDLNQKLGAQRLSRRKEYDATSLQVVACSVGNPWTPQCTLPLSLPIVPAHASIACQALTRKVCGQDVCKVTYSD
jgi:hypothetical protein